MRNSTFIKSFLLLCALIVGAGTSWAADVEIATATFNGKKAIYTEGWTTTGTGVGRTDCVVIGAGENITSPAFDLTGYSKVTITFSARRYGTLSGSKATVDASIGGVSQGTLDITNGSVGAVSGNINFEPTELMTSAVLVFTCTNATSPGSTHGAGIGTITIMGTPKGGGGVVTKVATPVFTPGGNTYNVVQNVTISCETEGATIHYTTNGNEPTESDATYSSAISVTKSGTVLKAKAFKQGLDPSSVASASYTIKPNKPTITATGATITITGDDGCTFYYTTNGDTPDNTKTVYTAPFDLDADCTIKAKAYDAYGNASDVYTLKYKYMPLAPKNVNSGYFVKVTDASDLENGDAIMIVNEEAGKALGPQSGNNCPGKTVTIAADVISNIGDAQKLVLVKKTEEIDNVDTDVFYFYTGGAYLYAASSSSNYLKTETTPDGNNNARATISITNGDATITFTGTYTRNVIMFNPNNGSPLFSCYASSTTNMEPVQIYKEVPVAATVTAAGWATWVAPKTVEVPSTVKAYYVKVNGTKTSLTEKSVIPAGIPVLLQGEGVHEFTVTDVVPNEAIVNDLLISGAGEQPQNPYVLAKPAGKAVGFYKWTDSAALPTGKVYIEYPASTAPDFIAIGDDATGIEDAVKSEEISDKSYYNLNGQRVAQPAKGLYIVNGKKVIIK